MFEFIFPVFESLESNKKIISQSYFELCENCVRSTFDREYIEKLIDKNAKFSSSPPDDSSKRFQKFKEDLSAVWRMNLLEIQDQFIYKNLKFRIEEYNSFQKNKKDKIRIDFSRNIFQNGIIRAKKADLKKYPTTQTWYKYESKKYDKFLGKYDLNQESGMKFGQPIKILNFTGDRQWAVVLTSEKTIGFTQSFNFITIDKKQEDAFLEDEFRNKPLDFNKNSLMTFFQTYLEIQYDWGDKEGKGFDCSSILKDYFNSFGIFMNRNSFDQINQKNITKIEIPENLNISERKKFILENAKPFKSILNFKGHVMLFCGEDPEKKGEIIVFHSNGFFDMKKKNDKTIYKIFPFQSIIGNFPDEIFVEKNPEFEPLHPRGFVIERIDFIGNVNDF